MKLVNTIRRSLICRAWWPVLISSLLVFRPRGEGAGFSSSRSALCRRLHIPDR